MKDKQVWILNKEQRNLVRESICNDIKRSEGRLKVIAELTYDTELPEHMREERKHNMDKIGELRGVLGIVAEE